MKRIGAILTAFSLLLSGMTAFAETVPAEEADRAATLTAPLSEEETAQITMQDLQALNGLGLTVYEEEGRVTFVSGSCSTDPVKNPEDAERVISSMLTLMGGNERTRFEPWRVLTDTRGNRYYALLIFCVLAEPSGRVSAMQIYKCKREIPSQRSFQLCMLVKLIFCGKTRNLYSNISDLYL